MNRAEQEALIIKYRYLVRSVAYSVSNEAAKDEDALQNGLIGLWEATKKWDGNRPFEPLARRCIRCNIIDYIRSIHPDDSWRRTFHPRRTLQLSNPMRTRYFLLWL